LASQKLGTPEFISEVFNGMVLLEKMASGTDRFNDVTGDGFAIDLNAPDKTLGPPDGFIARTSCAAEQTIALSMYPTS
jgi:hypothetical protein